MIKRLNIILVLGLFLFFIKTEKAYAQDHEYSQFFSAPLHLNPAMAGVAYCPRIITNFRDQWTGPNQGLKGIFVTSGVSYDQHFDALSGGVGLYVLSDKAGLGALSTTSMHGMYSYQLKVNSQTSIRLAAEVSYRQRLLDWSALLWGDQLDPRFGEVDINGVPAGTSEVQPSNTLVSHIDFATGGLIYSPNFFFGVSVKHLTRPNVTVVGNNQVARLPIRYNFHLGTSFKLDKRYKTKSEMSPNIMFTTQGAFKQLNIGTYFSKSAIFGGIWYRIFTHPDFSSDALILVAGVKYNIFKFSYSYDITTSKLTPGSGGAHEIGIAINFCDGDNFLNTKSKKRPLDCPEMLTF